MKDLFKRMANTSVPSQKTSAGSRVILAAFGKHPGWDDHIPGIGVDTETLARVKQALYVSGIGGQIDSGAWERLEPEKRLEGFDHTFLWLRTGHVLLGRLWSSTDRKGRSKYPMVLCADGEGVAPEKVLTNVPAELERLRAACQATTSAEQVTLECRAAQHRLDASLRESPQAPAGRAPASDTKQRFLQHRDFGADRMGLLRVTHELNNAMGTSRGALRSGKAADLRSHHLRVPLCGDSQGEGLLLWSAFLRCAFPTGVPLLLMGRSGTDWLDIIIGEPASDEMFCLQASRKASPLATEIPYELAPELKAQTEEMEAKFLGLQPPASLDPKGLQKRVAAPLSTPRSAEVGAVKPRKRMLAFSVGAGVVILLLTASVWVVLRERPSVSGEQGLNYQAALSDGLTALKQTNYTVAIAQANVALGIKPNDAAAAKLRNEAQRQLDLANAGTANKQKYQTAMAEGKSALAGKDYPKATTQANLALGIKAGDPEATKLRADAQRELGLANTAKVQEQTYQTAMAEGKSALEGKDFTKAIAQANVALGIKAGDSEATKLRNDAQRELDLANAAKANEQKYRTAMAEGKSALEGKDYPKAITQANLALGIKAGDSEAAKLRNDAQKELDLANTAKANEQKYQTAMTEGRSALEGKDYPAAVRQANVALGIKPGDPPATKLRNDAERQLDQVNTEQVSESPRSRDDVSKLDATLDLLDVWFGIDPKNDKRVLDPNTKGLAKPLPFGGLRTDYKEDILRKLDSMEKRYQETGLLDQRKDRIAKLKDKIVNRGN